MSFTPSQKTHRKQRGAALMVMLVIFVMGAATFLVSSLGSTALKISHNKSTAIALAQAKEALIGYAVTYGDAATPPVSAHGFLPCPDVDGTPTEGQESATCGAIDADVIGRFPWKSLGLPPLKDGNGECLWYAVSGTYKSNPPTATPMNWDNTGKLSVFTDQGVQIEANEIVAVVFSPGPISSQNRSGAAAPICGGNYDPANYLDDDTDHAINNSTIADGFIMPHEHRDVNGDVTTTINDQFIYITRQDIWQAIQLRVARETRACLENFTTTSGGTYPWAAPINDTAIYVTTPNTQFGRIPRKDSIPLTADPDILALQDTIIALQTATNSCKVANNAANRNALDDAGDDLENLADDIRNNQPTTPPMSAAVTSPAEDAGDDAQDAGRCADILADPEGNSVQTNLDAANAAFDPFFPDFSWSSASCTQFFTSITWEPWRDLVFYQVADGFTPADAGVSCGVDCLSAERDGQPMPGSGTYQATVVIAGGNLVASRATANLSDYLETDNRQPQADSTQPYKTYNASDINYPTTNDLVLCLDGQVSCQ